MQGQGRVGVVLVEVYGGQGGVGVVLVEVYGGQGGGGGSVSGGI